MNQSALKAFLAKLANSIAELAAVADLLDDAGVPDGQRLTVVVEIINGGENELWKMSPDELKPEHFRALRELHQLITSLKEKDDAGKRASMDA